MSKFNLGDIVKGNTGTRYGITSNCMTEGQITGMTGDSCDNIRVKILKHTTRGEEVGQEYSVDERYFDLVRSAKQVVGTDIEVSVEGIVSYVTIGGKFTIAVPTGTPVGISSKHDDDEFNVESGKAISLYRMMTAFNAMEVK